MSMTTPETPEIAPEGDTGKRLTAEQWDEIVAAFNFGTKRVAQLASEYGVSPAGIHKRFLKRRTAGEVIEFGSKKHLLKVEEKVAGAVAAAAAVKIASFADKRKLRIEQTRETIYVALTVNAKKAHDIQRSILDGSVTPAAAASDIKALRHMEALLEKNFTTRAKILNIDGDIDEAALPKLVFEDLSKDEIREIQEFDADEADTAELEEEDDVVVEEGGKPEP